LPVPVPGDEPEVEPMPVPEVEPLPGVVEALPVEPVVLPLPGFVEFPVAIPVPEVLLPIFVVGVVLVGGTILCWFVGTVVLVAEPVVEPVPWVGCVPTPTEPCEEFPVPLELPSMGVGFLPEPLPGLLSTVIPWALTPLDELPPPAIPDPDPADCTPMLPCEGWPPLLFA
jgi:hypothetical protein